MDGHGRSSAMQEQGKDWRRTLRSHHDREEGGASDSEAAANNSDQVRGDAIAGIYPWPGTLL